MCRTACLVILALLATISPVRSEMRGVAVSRFAVEGTIYEVALVPAVVEHVFTRDIAGTLIVVDGVRDGPMTTGHPAVKAIVRRADGQAMDLGDRGRAVALAQVICDTRGKRLERARRVQPGVADAAFENGIWGIYRPCR